MIPYTITFIHKVVDHYYESDKTQQQIADECNLKRDTFQRWCRKYAYGRIKKPIYNNRYTKPKPQYIPLKNRIEKSLGLEDQRIEGLDYLNT